LLSGNAQILTKQPVTLLMQSLRLNAKSLLSNNKLV